MLILPSAQKINQGIPNMHLVQVPKHSQY